ncbi:MAG: PQQ-binding-like beta-propeller repeat protein [Chloroflexi bacterium]|nr:PQQ-binding-like beta-propeller repeat protein [Chloroflexota bacterium]
MLPEIFCPNCQTYLGPLAAQCACGWQRTLPSPAPGEALWQAQIPGPAQHVAFTGNLVIFSWGQRRAGAGGLAAFHRRTGQPAWMFPAKHAIIGGLTPSNGKLYFATLGFLGGDARLYCLDRDTGKELWSSGVSGGVWGPPIIWDARIYLASDDGRVSAFDLETGQPLSHTVMQLPRGRARLTQVGDLLIGLSQTGQINAYNLAHLRLAWNQPLEVGSPIASPPVTAGNLIFFGTDDGRLVSFDVRDRRLETFARSASSLIAAPLIVGNRIYIGGRDHHLRAFDRNTGLEIWHSPEFAHSISVSPVVWENWIGVCVNQKGFYLLDKQDGSLVWKFELGGGVKLFSTPGVNQGYFYLGTDTGQIYALPWHLGRYFWAAEQSQLMGKSSQAGAFYVHAAHQTTDVRKRQEYYQLAESCWDQAGQPEKAAKLWEHLIEERKAAEAYCRAAELIKSMDRERAAEYYLQASLLYWQLDNQPESRRCESRAQKLAGGPLLRVKPWTNPQMTQYEAGRITFRIENIGAAPAKGIIIDLGGSLFDAVQCQILDSLPQREHFDVTLTITPTRLENNVDLRVGYRAVSAEKNLHTTNRIIVEAELAPHEVELTDVVAMRGLKIDVTGSTNRRVRVKMDGVVARTINLGNNFAKDEAK